MPSEQTDSMQNLMGDVDLPLRVTFGKTDQLLRKLLDMRPGSVIGANKIVGEPMDLCLGSRVIARGELVVVNGRNAIRVSEVLFHPGR